MFRSVLNAIPPCATHLEQVIYILRYLNFHHNTELCFDHNIYELKDWTTSEFGHVQGKEELPQPRSSGFAIGNVSDSVTRRSQTGILVYINSTLVYWSLKKQPSVELSSFGSEFIAIKQCCEYLHSLC